MWLRILSMTAGSVISAMTRNVPPHSGQTVTSNSKARLSGASHDVVPKSAALDQAALAELEGSTDSKDPACGCASCASYPARVWRVTCCLGRIPRDSGSD